MKTHRATFGRRRPELGRLSSVVVVETQTVTIKAVSYLRAHRELQSQSQAICQRKQKTNQAPEAGMNGSTKMQHRQRQIALCSGGYLLCVQTELNFHIAGWNHTQSTSDKASAIIDDLHGLRVILRNADAGTGHETRPFPGILVPSS